MKNNRNLFIVAGIVIALSVIVLLISYRNSCKQNVPTQTDSSQQMLEQEINAWHTERISELKKEYGWLSLVALDWLHEGKNTIESVGVLTLQKGKPFIEIEKQIGATLSGKKFTSGVLKIDAEKNGPDTIMIGSRAFIILKRGERNALRILDAESPVRKQFSGIERYPVSNRWRIEARWQQYEKPRKENVETVTPGYFEEGVVYGAAVFSIDGTEYRLEPIVNESLTDYFFIIGDKTNGIETYGGGRLLHCAPRKDYR